MIVRGWRVLGHLSEINGDAPLSTRERWKYLASGIRDILQGHGATRGASVWDVDLGNPAVRSECELGASPFRSYTTSILDALVPRLSGTGPVCDIGCGRAGQARHVQRSGDTWYLGVDIARQQDWSRPRSDASLGQRRFVVGSATELPLRNDSVAGTLSSSSFEHFPDASKAAHEVERVMRPGAFGLHIVPGVWSLPLYMFHGYRRYSAESLADAFRGAGLEVVDLWQLGGAWSFVLHLVWITCLESGAIFDWIAIGRLPGLLRRVVRPIGPRARQGRAKSAYVALLFKALEWDRQAPFVPVAYAVMVRKPDRTA